MRPLTVRNIIRIEVRLATFGLQGSLFEPWLGEISMLDDRLFSTFANRLMCFTNSLYLHLKTNDFTHAGISRPPSPYSNTRFMAVGVVGVVVETGAWGSRRWP